MFLSRCAVVLVFTYTAMLFSIGEGCADPIDGLTLTQLMIEIKDRTVSFSVQRMELI